MVVGILFSRELLSLMGASAESISDGYLYTTIILSTNLIIMLLFIINAIFRGAGDAAIAMRVLWLANGINLILDPCLILGLGPFPELGIKGAAIATAFGRGMGVVFQLYKLFEGRSRVKLSRRHIRADLPVL